MSTTFTIRAETPNDRAAIATILARTYLAQGAGAIELVSQLRDHPLYQPEHALLAVAKNKALAYALLTPVKVGNTPQAAVLLAPIAIDPQSEAISAETWVAAVVTKAAELGHRYILVHGDPKVYLPHGFVPAQDHAVYGAPDDAGDLFMLKNLKPDQPVTLSGAVEYPDA